MNINTVFKVSRVFNLRDNVGLDYWWEQRARTRMATTSPWDQKVINVSHKKRRERRAEPVQVQERREMVGGCGEWRRLCPFREPTLRQGSQQERLFLAILF